MKYRLRQLAIKYSKEKAHKHKCQRSFLEKKSKHWTEKSQQNQVKSYSRNIILIRMS